jgi:hypothetical protein
LPWLRKASIAIMACCGVTATMTDKHGAAVLERGAPIAGEIRIGDRNYARAPVLKRFLADACGKADFIVRLGWNALQLSTPRGKPFDLIGFYNTP